MTSQCIFNLLGKTKIQIDDNHKTEIEDVLRKLRDLLTNTPIVDSKTVIKSNLPVQVKNNIIYLSGERFYEIESRLDKLKDLYLGFEIAINRG